MQRSLYFFMLLTACSAHKTHYVKPTPDTPCPGEPCHTLSEYAHVQDPIVNMILEFLPGDHTLQQTMSVTNLVGLRLQGNSPSLPEITSRIVCVWPAGFVLRDITEVYITALAFISCGHKHSAAAHIRFVDHVAISNCLFQNNTNFIERGGALYIQESILNATENTFQDNSAVEGGALYIVNTVVITAVHTLTGNTFRNNHALVDGGSLYGKGKFSMLMLKNNTFQNDWADEEGGSVVSSTNNLNLILNIFQSNHALEKGGAIVIAGDRTTTITFEGNIFQNNSAGRGGVLYAESGNYTIMSNTFLNNMARDKGGALNLHFSSVTLKNNTFTKNVAKSGGAIFAANLFEFHDDCNMKILGRNYFRYNTAQYGGGIFLVSCVLELIEDTIIENNVASYGGGLYVHRMKSARIGGGLSLTGNSATLGGGGAYASMSTFNFTGNLTMASNSAADGGGLLLVGGSKFYLQPDTHVNFITNSAERTGGAIKVEEATPLTYTYCIDDLELFYDTLTECFFQIQRKPLVNISMHFQNNTAVWAGADVYGSKVYGCILNLKTYTYLPEVSENIFHDITGRENKVAISSNPVETCTCTSDYMLCNGSYHSKPVYPGGTLKVPVIARGYRNGTTSAVIQVIHSNITFITPHVQNTDKSCTVLRFNLHSFAVGTTQEMTLYAEGPCPPNEKNSLRVYVKILPCPPGFQLSQTEPVCICNKRLHRFTNTCAIDSKLIARPRFAEFWVGYDNDSGLILHPHCPLDYCLSEETHLAVDDSDKQCNYNRSGLLCGRCSESLSLVLGSSRCIQCSNSSLALLPAFVLAGIALVLLLLVLRLTVATGTINGLIFYANIVGVNSAIFFQPKTTNVLSVFIAWLNLDLGIETCFYNGMGAYTKVWLQFMFPFYVWALAGIVILGSHYSGRVARVFGSNPVAVLSTLLLLSYAKLLRLVFATLSYTSLEYPNNSHTAVWLYDGNIKYLDSKHIPLFIAAMICLIFLFLPYTIVLVFSQWLRKKSQLKIFSWINSNKMRPFLDAYHAPYTDKHRYWTGLMLLLRFVLFLISAVNVLGDSSVNLLATAFVSVAVVAFPTILGARIYKSWCLNVLEISFLLNLNILTGVSYHIRLTKGNQNAATFTSVSIALTTFTGIVIYHCIQQMKATKLWKRMLSQNHAYVLNRVSINPGLEDPPDAVFISGSAPTQTVVQISYHELREPCMATD